MVMRLDASARGIALLPVYARSLLPVTVISEPLAGVAPVIDGSLGTARSFIAHPEDRVARIGELKVCRA